MARLPSNQQLADKLDEVISNQKDFEKSIRKEMQAFRDFMVVQIDRQKRQKADGTLDWNSIIKQLLVALVAALGVIGTLVKLLGGAR